MWLNRCGQTGVDGLLRTWSIREVVPVRLQSGCELRGLPGIICDFTDLEPRGRLKDIGLDPVEIDDIAGRSNHICARNPSAGCEMSPFRNCVVEFLQVQQL